ncbi:unnamed protein product, partial [Ectocarpus sp. 4 AP-2014]
GARDRHSGYGERGGVGAAVVLSRGEGGCFRCGRAGEISVGSQNHRQGVGEKSEMVPIYRAYAGASRRGA